MALNNGPKSFPNRLFSKTGFTYRFPKSKTLNPKHFSSFQENIWPATSVFMQKAGLNGILEDIRPLKA